MTLLFIKFLLLVLMTVFQCFMNFHFVPAEQATESRLGFYIAADILASPRAGRKFQELRQKNPKCTMCVT